MFNFRSNLVLSKVIEILHSNQQCKRVLGFHTLVNLEEINTFDIVVEHIKPRCKGVKEKTFLPESSDLFFSQNTLSD